MSETFARSDQPWTLPPIPGYSAWRTERGGGDKGGGGLCILYRSTLTPHLWTPPVPSSAKHVENERQWLLIDNGKQKVAFLHCYIACQNSRSDAFIQWNEDLFHLMSMEMTKLREQGFITLCMGDFNSRVGRLPGLEQNTPDINKNGPMFLNFVTHANLVILNTLPVAKGLFTRYMNSSGLPGSKSLLDYGLINSENVNTVTSFVIDSEARHSCGSDHALLIANLIFCDKPEVRWDFHEILKFNIEPSTDYTKYQQELDLASKVIPLHMFAELTAEEKLSHITKSIIESGKNGIGLKTRKKKKPKKLPRALILRIKAKNALAKEIQQITLDGTSDTTAMKAKLSILKLDIKDTFTSMKLSQRFKLRSKLLSADPCRKKFWRFLKSQMKTAGSITGAYSKTGQMVFQQDEIEEAVIDHFSTIFIAKRSPVFTTTDHPDMIAMTLVDIDNLLAFSPTDIPEDKFEQQVCSEYTLAELTEILVSLPAEKAAGFDQLHNELIRNCSLDFKQYLLLFLNQIINEGRVPEELNLGKCVLIHKVIIVIPFTHFKLTYFYF